MADGKVKTVPEVVAEHSAGIKKLSLLKGSPNISITYTNIGEIQTGARLTNSGYTSSAKVETDIQNFASDILKLSDKIVADDQAFAQKQK